MKMRDALDIINKVSINRRPGFAVSFEWYSDGRLRSDHFPDVHREPGIVTEAEAWTLAETFADRMAGQVCNVYVVNAQDFVPVDGYKERKIDNR